MAASRIDSHERVVAPGFIDSHWHAQLAVIANPANESKTRQGVTTEILGKCNSRGRLRADLTVFDPATISANATFKDPQRYPDGIDWVLVGGQSAVAEGAPTGAVNGRVLRKGRPA
jgi:N-acyl-D-aspartate/D-glutamate deacylase